MQVTLTRRDNNGDSLGDKGHEWRGDPIIVWWTSNVGDLRYWVETQCITRFNQACWNCVRFAAVEYERTVSVRGEKSGSQYFTIFDAGPERVTTMTSHQ